MAKIKPRVRRGRVSVPFQLVKFFEERLQERGIPIQFKSSLDRECGSAKALLKLCKGRRKEAEALIQEFVKDDWEREHNRSLSRVVSLADDLRARVIQNQKRASESSDEILPL